MNETAAAAVTSSFDLMTTLDPGYSELSLADAFERSAEFSEAVCQSRSPNGWSVVSPWLFSGS